MGPLLFCLYINEVKTHLNPNISHLVYADDLQIYVQVSPENVSEAITTLSLAAGNVSDWAHNISLKLNPDKTKAIYFGSTYFVDKLDKQNYPGVPMSKDNLVPFVKEIKSLEVIQ